MLRRCLRWISLLITKRIEPFALCVLLQALPSFGPPQVDVARDFTHCFCLSFFLSNNFINIPKISSGWTCYLLGWESLPLDQIRLLFLNKKNPEPFSFFVVIFTKILLLDKSHFEAKLSKRKVVCFLKENMWSEVFSRISTLKVITFHQRAWVPIFYAQ